MALSTYNDLKSSIASWMFDRQDLLATSADFIALCEGDLNRVLRTRDQLSSSTLVLDSESKAAIPDDYLEFRQVTALTSPRRPLSLVGPDYLDAVHGNRAAGVPGVFTILGGNIIVMPLTTADIDFSYYAKIPALADDNQTNWLLAKFPNLYLYGSLRHACVFIGQQDRAQVFGQMFNGELSGLVTDDRMAMNARTNARIRGCTP